MVGIYNKNVNKFIAIGTNGKVYAVSGKCLDHFIIYYDNITSILVSTVGLAVDTMPAHSSAMSEQVDAELATEGNESEPKGHTHTQELNLQFYERIMKVSWYVFFNPDIQLSFSKVSIIIETNQRALVYQ